MATKDAYLSGDELIAALAGELLDHPIKVNGKVIGKVQIRTLELAEVQSAAAKLKGDTGGLTLWALDNALANPKLTDGQREAIRKGKAGPLMDLAKYVMTTSGLTDEEESGSPLDGGTSS